MQKNKIKVCHEIVDSYDVDYYVIGDKPQKFKVDSESFIVRLDKDSSSYISNNIKHFIGPLIQIKNLVVKVYVVVVKVRGEGGIKWGIEYNYEGLNFIIIHNINYNPVSYIRFLPYKMDRVEVFIFLRRWWILSLKIL